MVGLVKLMVKEGLYGVPGSGDMVQWVGTRVGGPGGRESSLGYVDGT